MQYLATYLISNDYDDDKQATINYIMEMLILDMLYILILDPSKNIAVLLKQSNKIQWALRNVN